MLLEALRAKAAFASSSRRSSFDPAAIARGSPRGARKGSRCRFTSASRGRGAAEAADHCGRIGVADTPSLPGQERPVRDTADPIRAASIGRTAWSRAWRPRCQSRHGDHRAPLYTFNAVEATDAWRRSDAGNALGVMKLIEPWWQAIVTAREDRLAASRPSRNRLRLPLAAMGRPTPPGSTVPAEVVRRLMAVEAEVHRFRLRQVAVEDDPHCCGPTGLAAGSNARLQPLDAFEAIRARDRQARLRPHRRRAGRHGTHATYGRLDVEGLLRLASDHDAGRSRRSMADHQFAVLTPAEAVGSRGRAISARPAPRPDVKEGQR